MSKLALSLFAEQIGATDVSDKEKITAEQKTRHLGTARFIKHRPADVFRSVTGAVQRTQAHAAELDLVSVAHNVVGIARSPFVATHSRGMNDGFVFQPRL